jgi:hypothetical protein
MGEDIKNSCCDKCTDSLMCVNTRCVCHNIPDEPCCERCRDYQEWPSAPIGDCYAPDCKCHQTSVPPSDYETFMQEAVEDICDISEDLNGLEFKEKVRGTLERVLNEMVERLLHRLPIERPTHPLNMTADFDSTLDREYKIGFNECRNQVLQIIRTFNK